MPSRPLLTVTGRDVLFAHWPVDAARLAPHVPDPLAVDTFDGTGWVSALALENTGAAPGSVTPPPGLRRVSPQLNLRTYVTHDGEPGVYFLSLDSGDRLAAALGRRVFGLPFRPARMRLRRRDDEVRFSSRRERAGAAFDARYRPTGDPHTAAADTVASFCVERFRYFLPPGEGGNALAGLRGAASEAVGDGGANEGEGDLVVGRIDREDWTLRGVDATLRTNTLFEAAGLPRPDGDPVLGYSPGFEMAVLPPERRAVD